MGTIFSAGLLGGLIGALPAIHLDLRFGRRKMMHFCLLWFAAGSALTAVVTNASMLLAVRLFTGIGLGMAVPLLMGTMTDSVPAGIRARALALITCAIPAGGLLGGILAAAIMPVAGWRILFVIGAIAPLVLMLPLQKAMKAVEHRFNALKSGSIQSVGETVRFVGEMFRIAGVGLILLLATNFFSMLLGFSLMNWTPSLLVSSGTDTSYASLAGGLLNGGAMIAILSLGYVLDRRDALITGLVCYGLAAVSLLALSGALDGGSLTLAVTTVAGFFGIGSQICLNYLIADSVRQDQRVAVLGVAMIASRSGGAVGPLLLGMLIQVGWTSANVFVVLRGARHNRDAWDLLVGQPAS